MAIRYDDRTIDTLIREAIAAIRELAGTGDRSAQFHMGSELVQRPAE